MQVLLTYFFKCRTGINSGMGKCSFKILLKKPRLHHRLHGLLPCFPAHRYYWHSWYLSKERAVNLFFWHASTVKNSMSSKRSLHGWNHKILDRKKGRIVWLHCKSEKLNSYIFYRDFRLRRDKTSVVWISLENVQNLLIVWIELFYLVLLYKCC